jgi:hypothetical protein
VRAADLAEQLAALPFADDAVAVGAARAGLLLFLRRASEFLLRAKLPALMAEGNADFPWATAAAPAEGNDLAAWNHAVHLPDALRDQILSLFICTHTAVAAVGAAAPTACDKLAQEMRAAAVRDVTNLLQLSGSTDDVRLRVATNPCLRLAAGDTSDTIIETAVVQGTIARATLADSGGSGGDEQARSFIEQNGDVLVQALLEHLLRVAEAGKSCDLALALLRASVPLIEDDAPAASASTSASASAAAAAAAATTTTSIEDLIRAKMQRALTAMRAPLVAVLGNSGGGMLIVRLFVARPAFRAFLERSQNSYMRRIHAFCASRIGNFAIGAAAAKSALFRSSLIQWVSTALGDPSLHADRRREREPSGPIV